MVSGRRRRTGGGLTGSMSGAYTFVEALGRLHPRYLFEESRGQLVDAFWGSQDLGEPNLDEFTGL